MIRPKTILDVVNVGLRGSLCVGLCAVLMGCIPPEAQPRKLS